MTISPTPHADVNEILDLLLTNVKEALRDQFVGMYLFGSLANGGFDEHSDIDVLIVAKDEITAELFSALQAMHKRISKVDSRWAFQLEVSYIPQNALRHYDPSNNMHPHLDRDQGETLHMMRHVGDWIIQRYILRERGIIVTGPDPKSLIDPVSPNDLRQAIADLLPVWVQPVLDHPFRINRRGYQSYFVLSMCRVLYTHQHGEIVSKPFAARWARENLDKRWIPLIERAWIGRQNSAEKAQPADIDGTLDMMRYTLDIILSDQPEQRNSGTTSKTLHSSESNRPTPYPDVNKVLNLLLANVKELLEDQFVGMYLYGSLASGDFNPASSDIDFLIVTKDTLSEKTISKLKSLHNRLWKIGMKWASKLEGAYIPQKDIRRYNRDSKPAPTINEGKFYIGSFGSDWIIQRHVLREWGVVLDGPDPKTLIDPIGPRDIRRAVLGVLNEWWFPMLDDPSWLQSRDSHYHSFAVITMCRALHALQHGAVVSKPVAVQWAKEELDPKWHPLIEQALASQYGGGPDFLSETLDFIRFTRGQIQRYEFLMTQTGAEDAEDSP